MTPRWSLKFADWPDADQHMWRGLIARGHVLDEAGPGSHWRSATRKILVRDWGFFLAFLIDEDVDLDQQGPIDRVTPLRVRRYIASLSQFAPSTQAGAIRSLDVIFRRAAPMRDWRWLGCLRRPLDAADRRNQGKRRQHRVVASNVLLDLGVRLMESAGDIRSVEEAVRFRDGLLIALLASRPVRLANLSYLTLSRHLKRIECGGYLLRYPAEEVKTGIAMEYPVPKVLTDALKRYLSVARPILLRGRAYDVLWIGKEGRPLGYHHLGLRISKLTDDHLGVSVSPHLFRTSAATTIATADPSHVGSAKALLGHSDPRTTERYYNQARSIEAGRAHNANIEALRERLRGPIKYKRVRQGG